MVEVGDADAARRKPAAKAMVHSTLSTRFGGAWNWTGGWLVHYFLPSSRYLFSFSFPPLLFFLQFFLFFSPVFSLFFFPFYFPRLVFSGDRSVMHNHNRQ